MFKNYLNFIISSFIAFLSIIPSLGLPKAPENFSEAKKIAQEYYQLHHPHTFYSQCHYSNKQIDHKSCNYQTRANNKRASRLEWEHIVPASVLGKSIAPIHWQKKLCTNKKGRSYGGRSCCRLKNIEFRHAEADLHNIVPSVGEINADRQNFRFGVVHYPKFWQKQYPIFDKYSQDSIKIAPTLRIVEPPRHTRGFIARTYLYMTDKYNIKISTKEKLMYKHWNSKYPPSKWEVKRNKIIFELQGDYNYFINK